MTPTCAWRGWPGFGLRLEEILGHRTDSCHSGCAGGKTHFPATALPPPTDGRAPLDIITDREREILTSSPLATPRRDCWQTAYQRKDCGNAPCHIAEKLDCTRARTWSASPSNTVCSNPEPEKASPANQGFPRILICRSFAYCVARNTWRITCIAKEPGCAHKRQAQLPVQTSSL